MSESWRGIWEKIKDAFIGEIPDKAEDLQIALRKEEPALLKMEVFVPLKGLLMGAFGILALAGFHVHGHAILALYTSLGCLTYHGLIKSVRVDRMHKLVSVSAWAKT